MDQSTAIIIASAISVIGGVGGSLGGVFLTNHQALKLETLRIGQENVRKKNQTIEDAHSLLMRFDELTNHTLSDLRIGNMSDFNFFERSKEIFNTRIRLQTLIRLYLPSSVYNDFEQMSKTFTDYWMSVANMYDEMMHAKRNDVIRQWNSKVDETRTKYMAAWGKLEESLVNLVK